MDKAEYQAKLEELQGYLQLKDYKGALMLVDDIDWKKVKSVRTLNMVADIYEINKQYDKCRDVLTIALSRSSIGKNLLYRLCEVCIKQKDLRAAQDYFKQYSKIASRDNSKLLLEYKLAKGTNRPHKDQIRLLEEYKDREYTEKWAYELAKLYSKAGDIDKCVETCDDLILWFSEGKYVLKAMELKKKYHPLTLAQQIYYDKEQKDSDARLVFHTANIDLSPEIEKPRKKANVIDWMNEAGAELTKDVNIENTGTLPISKEDIDSVSVTSPQFMGGRPDLKKQLEKSIESVQSESRDKPEEGSASIDSELPLEDFLSTQEKDSEEVQDTIESIPKEGESPEEHSTLNEREIPLEDSENNEEKESEESEKTDAQINEEAEQYVNIKDKEVSETSVEKSEEAEKAVEQQESSIDKAEIPLAEDNTETKSETPYMDDREIPDIEPSDAERLTHTIPLDKVGQNTIPMPIEEIIKNETPEERRIRILNNTAPTKMSDIQRRIFTYFARVPGMDIQILEALSSVYKYAGEHTSKHGNIVIMGSAGTGKSRLSDGLIVAMCRDMGLEVAKMARTSGERMNILDPVQVVAKMSGGFLVIENAGDMTPTTISKLNKAMEFRTDCMILIIEDDKTAMRAFLNKYPDFAEKFSASISIPVFTNDELVAFARIYCTENKCKMDELGVLALYSMISSGQSEDHPMTISEVKEILDFAISRAKRRGRRGRKGANKDTTLVLYEKDFDLYS